MAFTPEDEKFMLRALALARRGREVSPNPYVGCVLVKNGKVAAEGFHGVFGGPHAEAIALKKAGARAKGSCAYVTLEPCVDHSGKKTPPCAPALVRAGVSRVVAAMPDPNPRVSGRGMRLLRRAGVSAEMGLLKNRAERLNRSFLWRMRRRRPYVVLKAALSLDGRASTPGGSKWITGLQARRLARKMRSECAAVLVGSGTVLADNPSLTSRGVGKNPVRVILDSRLRTPKGSKVLDGSAPTWIFTAKAGKKAGAEVIRVGKNRDGLLDLKEVLHELARRGVGSVFVEGGPKVHASFMRSGCIDDVRFFIAPKLLAGARSMKEALAVRDLKVKRAGRDLLFLGRI